MDKKTKEALYTFLKGHAMMSHNFDTLSAWSNENNINLILLTELCRRWLHKSGQPVHISDVVNLVEKCLSRKKLSDIRRTKD